MMDPIIKEKWVKALRSGGYKQGRRSLKTPLPDGTCEYCCLGVLMQVKFGGFPRHADPYKPLGDLVGDKLPNGPLDGPIATLIAMNDDKRAPFPKIADWIEANL